MEIRRFKIVYVKRNTNEKVIEYFDSIQQAENRRAFLVRKRKIIAFVGRVEKIK